MILFAKKVPITKCDDRPKEWLTAKAPTKVPRTRPQTISQFFAILKNLPSQREQIDFLRLNQSPALLTFLRCIIDPLFHGLLTLSLVTSLPPWANPWA